MQLNSCIIKWKMKFGAGKGKLLHMGRVNFKVLYEMMNAEMIFSSQKQDVWDYTIESPIKVSAQYLVATRNRKTK